MSVPGIFRSGVLRRCAEPTPNGTRVPECIGRAVMERCTCPLWTRQQIGAAEEIGATATSREELVDALVDAGWTYRLAMRLVFPEDARFQRRAEAAE